MDNTSIHQIPNPDIYMVTDREAREKLAYGVRLMYLLVCSTLSPKGRNVAIARQFGAPIVVHDGVTVAREVKHPDPFVMMGINLIKEAAQKTNEEAGDGTTTSTLIAYEIISRGIALINKGKNPMILRNEIYKGLEDLKPFIQKLSKEAKSFEDLKRVATISSADEQIGHMVAEAVTKVGKDGLVTVEEGNGADTYIKYTEGLTIDKGFASPYFATNTKTMEATVSKPVIAIIDKPIAVQREIVPLIEAMITVSKNIVLIADITGDALGILVNNKMRGNINALVVPLPGYGDNRRDYLEDLAVMTGATVFSKELGMDAEQFADAFDIGWLGKADKVVSTKKTTLLVKPQGKINKIKDQITKIRKQKDKAEIIADRERFEERLAKLTTGVAVIRVGAKTQVEGREKLERVKDAVGAAQSALAEGVVPGSGVTFMHLADHVNGNTPGAKLLREVLNQPIRKVMINSGESNKRRWFGLKRSRVDELVEYIKSQSAIIKTKEIGYDSMQGGVKNMLVVGITDPTKVIRLCLENGVGVATSILTTDGLIDLEPARKMME